MNEKLKSFCEVNPYDFTQEQIERLIEDVHHPRTNLVSDEKVDFNLWTKGLKSRQDYFASFIEKIFDIKEYHHLLEVGCGHNARLSKILHEKGYQMSAMDPKLNITSNDITYIQDSFIFSKIDISKYDAIIAQEPCDATEHIVRACIQSKKNFIISLCGSCHGLINGQMCKDTKEWYDYLECLSPNCCIIYPNMVPGYITPIIIGIF